MKYHNEEFHILEGFAGYQEISEADFRSIVLAQGKSAIITFCGDWMGSAAMLHLIMEDLSLQYVGKTHFFCVNIDKSTLASEFGITNTATVCFFNKGEIFDQQIGLIPKSNLRYKVEKFITTLS